MTLLLNMDDGREMGGLFGEWLKKLREMGEACTKDEYHCMDGSLWTDVPAFVRKAHEMTAFQHLPNGVFANEARERTVLVEPTVIKHALAVAFAEKFAESNLIYILKTGSSNLKCYSHTHSEEVKVKANILNTTSFELPARAVAYKLYRGKKNGKLKAKHLCLLPLEKYEYYPEVNLVALKVGSVVAARVMREKKGFFWQLFDQFILIPGYNPVDSTLTTICSDAARELLRDYIKERTEEISKVELDWKTLTCWVEDCKALVTFGPGLCVQAVKVASDNVTLADDAHTIRVEAPATDTAAFLDNLADLVADFCMVQFGSPPQFFLFDNTFYATFPSAEGRKCFESKTSTGNVPIELVQEGLLECLLSENPREPVREEKCKPTDECLICCLPLEATQGWLRLLFCGHILCHKCIVSHLGSENSRFPLGCAVCQQLISVKDLQAAFRGTFKRDLPSFRAFLQPILVRSLRLFVDNNADFIHCTGCQSLLRANPDEPSILCPECKDQRCRQCGDHFHAGVSCYQNQWHRMVQKEPLVMQWIGEDNTRRLCPNKNCNALLERLHEGCNHFQCSACSIHFCWICENFMSATSQAIYAHLQEVHGTAGFFDRENMPQAEFDAMMEDWDERFFPGEVEREPVPTLHQRLGDFGPEDVVQGYRFWLANFHDPPFPW